MAPSDDHAERLLLELQHRVKNMAAVIRAIARKTAESSDDLGDFRARFDGRLGALVRAHAAMSRTTEEGVDLEEIIRDALLENAPAASNWSVDGPNVRLAPSLTETLALVFHELAVEAALAGALNGSDGRVAVTWSVQGPDDGRLVLDWREDGAPDRRVPEGFAFCRELLDRALPYQFSAQADATVGPQGLHCRIEAPLRSASPT